MSYGSTDRSLHGARAVNESIVHAARRIIRSVPRVHLQIITLALISGCGMQQRSDTSFRDVALREFRQYPQSQPMDLFKLAYQAAMGTEHMHLDVKQAREWLRAESEGLATVFPEEPLFAAISPDGSIVRVNLRPYVRGGRNLDSLAMAFVNTSTLVQRDTARLVGYWKEVVWLAARNRIPMSAAELTVMLETARASSFPAPGHSQEYHAAYRPAYRVVHRSLLPRLGITR